MIERICEDCGTTMLLTPEQSRARKYCDTCRKERMRQNSRDSHYRKKHGLPSPMLRKPKPKPTPVEVEPTADSLLNDFFRERYSLPA